MEPMTWTTANRYQPYEQWPETYRNQVQQAVSHSRWRLGYHIQPTTGLLNDPNGFSYYNGQWHLFYQTFPFGPVHGLKSWNLLTSSDLVHWQDKGLKLLPDQPFDAQGVYSGSALPIGEKLFITYNGNVRDDQWVRHPKQNGAWLQADESVTKLAQPLIDDVPEGYTDHFRDPQIVEHEGYYYLFLGAQRIDKTGHIVAYRAQQVTGPWTFLGEVDMGSTPWGYMIECPNLVFIDHRPVILFCPQGIAQADLPHQNVYPNAYIVGADFDWDQLRVIEPTKPKLLDQGFEAYATQAFNAPDGQVLATSWIGLPDMTYPSDADDWSGALSLVKQLTLDHDVLKQVPVASVDALKLTTHSMTTTQTEVTPQSVVQMTLAANQEVTLTLWTNQPHTTYLTVVVNTTTGQVTLDRLHAGIPVNPDYGTTRIAQVAPHQDVQLDFYLDNSVFELYLNQGEQVMTGRLFSEHPAYCWELPVKQVTSTWSELDSVNN